MLELLARMAPLDLLKDWTLYLASAVEGAAALIIGVGALEATFRAAGLFAHRGAPESQKDAVRMRLGRWLALALEFELAADILRTAVAPTWDEIGKLAAIVVLRTVLNFFLQREIAESERARVESGSPSLREKSEGRIEGRIEGRPEGRGEVIPAGTTRAPADARPLDLPSRA